MTDMRLIDANALHDHVMEEMRRNPHCGHIERMMHRHEHESFLRDIRLAPTVDAIPVVHGRWIFGTTMNREWMKCSKCLVSQTPTGVFSYCPNCGARMDGDGND